MTARVCFFAPVTDKEILTRVQFYAQDLEALGAGGRHVHVATRWADIPWDAEVYYVWWWTWAFLPLAKAWLVGRPVVITGAFDYRWPEPGLDYVNRPSWQRWLMRLGLASADANLFISNAELRDVVAHLPVSCPVMAMPGVDTDRYRPDPSATRGKTVFTLAWLEAENARRKGIFEIVQAVPHVLARVPDARFVIAGVQGTAYPALRRLADDLGVAHAIDWPGRLDDATKIAAMQSCGVYLQPTVYEGFGLAIAEAMSCGAAVVSSPNGAVPEVVGEAGVLVPARSPVAIADAVVRVLGNAELRSALGTRARAHAERVFPLHVRAEAVRRLVDDVAARPGSPFRRLRAATLGRVLPPIADALRAGVAYLLVSYAAVQGLTYLMQLFVAWTLPPGDFGVVRSVEAVLGVALIVAGVGMPSLAVRTIADVDHALRRGAVLGRIAMIAVGGGLCVALLVVASATWLVPPEAARYLTGLSGILALTAVSRTLLNYFQGVQRVRDLARWQLAVAVPALAVMGLSVQANGLPGWIAGRYLGEALALVVAMFAVRNVIRWPRQLPASLGTRRLTALGLFIAAGLVLRSTLDQVGLLALGWAGQPIEAIGHFGLATLILTAVCLLPGALAQVYLPRLVQQRGEGGEGRWLLKRLGALGLVTGALVAVGGVAWDRFVSGPYHATGLLLALLAFVVPARTLALASALQLMVADRNGVVAAANAVALALALLTLPALAGRHGVMAVTWGTVAIEALLGASLWKLNRRYGAATPLAQS